MGAIQLSDELERFIEQQVAAGRAVSPGAFVEDAVMRLVTESQSEEEELQQAVGAGLADVEAGRYTLVTTPDDGQGLQDRLMAKLKDRLTGEP